MHITRAADYAVRVMIYLAGLPPDAKVARPEISKATATPDSFLAKVLQQLVQARMITSRRGSGGGFRLAVDSHAVSLLHVIEAMEGPTQLNTCISPGPSCERKSWCAAHEVWVEAQAALERRLRWRFDCLTREPNSGTSCLPEFEHCGHDARCCYVGFSIAKQRFRLVTWI